MYAPKDPDAFPLRFGDRVATKAPDPAPDLKPAGKPHLFLTGQGRLVYAPPLSPESPPAVQQAPTTSPAQGDGGRYRYAQSHTVYRWDPGTNVVEYYESAGEWSPSARGALEFLRLPQLTLQQAKDAILKEEVEFRQREKKAEAVDLPPEKKGKAWSKWLKKQKVFGLVVATEELLRDSTPDIEALVREDIAERLSKSVAGHFEGVTWKRDGDGPAGESGPVGCIGVPGLQDQDIRVSPAGCLYRLLDGWTVQVLVSGRWCVTGLPHELFQTYRMATGQEEKDYMSADANVVPPLTPGFVYGDRIGRVCPNGAVFRTAGAGKDTHLQYADASSPGRWHRAHVVDPSDFYGYRHITQDEADYFHNPRREVRPLATRSFKPTLSGVCQDWAARNK